MHVAVLAGKGATAEACLLAGADPLAFDCEDRSALMLAQCGHLNKDIDPLALAALTAATREAELRAGAAAGDPDLIERLVSMGVEMNAACPRTGKTALHEAAGAGSLDATRALLLAGAHPAIKDLSGRTPAQYAAFNLNEPRIYEAIIGAGGGSSVSAARGTLPPLVPA